MKKKSPKQAVADEIGDILKDLQRDIQILANGRATSSRYLTVSDQFWKVHELLKELDPNPPAPKPEPAPNPEPGALPHKPLSLEYKP